VRSEEQRAADEALTAAIERVMRAYEVKSPEDNMAEYVVVAALEALEEDGDITSSISFLLRDGKVHGSRVIGLLEDAKLQIAFDGMNRYGQD
jgi:hypothetical protein